jgi:hypothetical protein
MICYNCHSFDAKPCTFDLSTNDLRCQFCFDALNEHRMRRNQPLIQWKNRPTQQGDTDNELETDDDE